MFYAHFVLSKKGPLARVWLAAHWDKKLTKAHVFETNISNSVEAILEPKVKIALRTSGHLMLGVVRIYSRKAKYLLADCNEAFVKIKMAFRPGVVDLPEEHSHQAQIDKITLPDNFHDFESTINDINDIDMNTITVNQSRPEDITMREDYTEINLGRQEDDFGDLEFAEMPEKEMMRDASNVSAALYKSDAVGDSSTSLIVGESSAMKGTPDKSGRRSSGSRRRSGNIRGEVVEPEDMDDTLQEAEDDEFGEWAPDDDDNEGMGMDMFINETADIFDDPSAMKQLDRIVTSQIESHMGASNLQLSDQSGAVAGHGLSVDEPPLVATSGMTAGSVTTLVPDETEAFALPPIDTASTAGESMRSQARRQRKRRLIVDEQKSIPSEVMKSQMSDTADIVATLDLAPPTKKLMMWKETGSVDKLLAAPGRLLVARGHHVNRLFVRHLRTEAAGEDESVEGVEGVQDVQGVLPEPQRFPEMSTIQEESGGSMLPPPPPAAVAVDSLMTGADPVLLQVEDHDPLGAIMMAGPPSVLPGDTPFHYGTGSETPYPYNEPASVMNPPSVLSMPPASVLPQEDEEEESDATAAAARALEQQLEQEEAQALASGEAEATEDYEERRLERRGRVLLHVLKATLQRETSCNFKELTAGNTRKQAASKFYTLLALRKQDAVELQQTEPFADLQVSRGPKFTALLAS